MAVLLELADEATSFLVKGMVEENNRLRKELAKRRRTPDSVWTPQGRAAQSTRLKTYWARRRAEKAAVTASSQERDGLSAFLGNGNGHADDAWC